MKEEAEDTSLATFEEPHDASAPRAKYRGEPGHETTLPFVANGVEFRLMTNDFAGAPCSSAFAPLSPALWPGKRVD